MHGCPPGEIGQMASCLMGERGLHTTIKLNPTMTGRLADRNIPDASSKASFSAAALLLGLAACTGSPGEMQGWSGMSRGISM